MCELPEVFSTTARKAAKQHKCCECGKTIETGEQYQYSSGIWDSRPYSYKQCINCHELMSAAVTREGQYCDEGPSFGMLRDWFGEFQCRGFTGKEWLNGMAEEIGVEPEKLNRLLCV